MKELDFEFLEQQKVNIKLFVVAFLIIAIAIYVGFLVYGNRGLNRLIYLQNTQETFQKKVDLLKKENVKLQKEYFGLQDIEGNK